MKIHPTRYPHGFKGFYFASHTRQNPNLIPPNRWESRVEMRNRAMPGRPLMHATLGFPTYREAREAAKELRREMWRFLRKNLPRKD